MFLCLAVLQLYVLAPPSEHNLRLFCTWMEIRGTEHGLFLQDALEGLVKLQVRTYYILVYLVCKVVTIDFLHTC